MPELRGKKEVIDVLRYWLVALQAEASLASRPRAQRPGGRGPQSYVRLGAEHAALLLEGAGSAAVRADPAAHRFLEHWSRVTRRREKLARGGEGAAEWSAGWPTFYFARREELATLIRFPAGVEWRHGGAAWKGTGARPDTLSVRGLVERASDEDGFVVDRELLSTVLGLQDEEIARLERRWGMDARGEQIARDLLELLAPGENVRGVEVFDALVRAIQPHLPAGVSVWPTALVQDPGILNATYHLQNELSALIGRGDRPSTLSTGTVLYSYLVGRPGDEGRRVMLGRFRARGLTASQRAAGERFLGSELTAVQGPPGTGKTELILSLAAHVLVERIEALANGRAMPREQLVVASTNNRAVDNVLDPLSEEPSRLPLALRAGNQEVTASATKAALERASRWLEAQDDAGALEALDAALARFRSTLGTLRATMAPEEKRLRRRSQIAALEARIRRAREQEASASLEQRLADAVSTISREVGRMTQIIEEERGTKKLERVGKRWAALTAELPALTEPESVLARALHLPPQIPAGAGEDEALDHWLEGLYRAADAVAAARKKKRPKQVRDERRELRRWEKRLAKLQEKEADLPERAPSDLEALAHQAFVDALEVRERWAIANRAELRAALEKAREGVATTRSLRRALAKEPAARAALRRLYPVLGSTLLSLGNVFDDAPEAIDRLVIDEAGQCHPAYAISGLVRARSALIIGDVHQLPPVIRLSERDEARAQRVAHVDLSAERFAPYRVHEGVSTSAQALADRAVEVRPTLTDHFRCDPEIIALSDALAGYGLIVHTERRATNARLAKPLLFADVAGAQARARGSWANAAEAELLLELIGELRAAGVSWRELAVITPFVGQDELLRTELRRRGAPLADAWDDDRSRTTDALSIGTVHRFQGGERAIVLFSTVVTEPRSLPFLDDRANLLNVAVSRAREHLVIFGHAGVLRAGKHTRLLVERASPLPRRPGLWRGDGPPA